MKTNQQPVISINNLQSYYGELHALKNINLTIYIGDITVILGPSGCGKTTLLKHILGLYQPFSGSISVLDTNMENTTEKGLQNLRKRIGMLSQSDALLNSYTILENLSIALEQHTQLPPQIIRHMVQVKLDLLGIGETIDKMPDELSGGMKKRAALGRSISMDPELLFCDEPTSGLDPITSKRLDNLILSLRDKMDMSVVIVSHDVSSIRNLADRIVYMEKGEILFAGSIKEAEESGIAGIMDFFAD